jgi:hypothetical protein
MTRLNEPDAALTNGRYELPPSARGVLVLADPPEAGWRIEVAANAQASNSAVRTRESDGTCRTPSTP